MLADVQITEGGQLIRTEKMKLKLVKEFSNNITIYENEEGNAVIHFREKNDYILVSIDLA